MQQLFFYNDLFFIFISKHLEKHYTHLSKLYFTFNTIMCMCINITSQHQLISTFKFAFNNNGQLIQPTFSVKY